MVDLIKDDADDFCIEKSLTQIISWNFMSKKAFSINKTPTELLQSVWKSFKKIKGVWDENIEKKRWSNDKQSNSKLKIYTVFTWHKS